MTQGEILAPAVSDLAGAPSTNWLLQTLRLARWLLYTVRRRAMGKVIFGLLVGGLLLVVAIQVLVYIIALNSTPSGQTCTGSPDGGPPVCQPLTMSPDQVHAMQQAAAKGVAMGMTFPQSLTVVEVLVSLIGVIVLTTLAGAVVGGEYGHGTVRVQLSRGVGRAQLIAAEALALAALSLIATGVLMLIGILVGFTLGPALGGTLPAFASGAPVELLMTWLALSLNLFGYCAIALFFATLGRSTAAGIGFALGFFVAESVLGGILTGISFIFQQTQPNTAEFIRHIPDWFLGNNVGYIVQHASLSPLAISPAGDQGSAPFDMTHALLVTLLYLVLTIGGSYLLTRKRDITD
ncbi:MAG TPA: ABC transporter permease subunit [Ktedonobacterales bacterium]